MKWQLGIINPDNLVCSEYIIEYHTKTIEKCSSLITCLRHLRRQFIIFNDGWLSIFQTQSPNSLIRVCLSHHFCTADTSRRDRCTDKDRICHPLKDIIYRKNIQPFQTSFLNILVQSSLKHRSIPASVSVWRYHNGIFRLHKQVVIKIDDRHIFLPKKFNIIRIITEILMFCKKLTCLCIRLVTCHDVKRNPCVGLFLHIHQIVKKLFKNIQCAVHTNIEQSFCFIIAQSCSLSACK